MLITPVGAFPYHTHDRNTKIPDNNGVFRYKLEVGFSEFTVNYVLRNSPLKSEFQVG